MRYLLLALLLTGCAGLEMKPPPEGYQYLTTCSYYPITICSTGLVKLPDPNAPPSQVQSFTEPRR